MNACFCTTSLPLQLVSVCFTSKKVRERLQLVSWDRNNIRDCFVVEVSDENGSLDILLKRQQCHLFLFERYVHTLSKLKLPNLFRADFEKKKLFLEKVSCVKRNYLSFYRI